VAEARPLRLSAVIVCYLDAQAIPLMYQRLSDVFAALSVDHEIIFVNDGSPDDTASVLKALTAKDDHVLAIEHSRNFGSQNAFLSGMELATGDAVILLDGDLQDPPEVIPALYEKWREGNDVVYGRRSRREAPAIMNIAYRAFYRVLRGVAYVPVPLDAGDFSLMDRRVVDELLALPETDQFLRGLRAWVGFKQAGVDYVRPERAFGRSTHTRLKNLWWAKKAIFSFSFLPIEVLGYAAAAMTALSFAAVVYQIVDSLRHPEVSHGISTLVVLVVFFGSLTLLAISVVGEYLIRVFEEVKRRPRFIRKALWHGGNGLSRGDMETFVAQRKATRSPEAGAAEPGAAEPGAAEAGAAEPGLPKARGR
jgi:polyisoprenyl-phosphate glycosyltransferase